MKYKNYIFDLYGTLIDIHTDEEQETLWHFMSDYLKDHFNTIYTPKRLKDQYKKICADETAKLQTKNGSKHPEIKIEYVWQRLVNKDISEDEMRLLCNAFREQSRDKLEVYDGVIELFDKIKSDGGRIFLLSNAQRLFTEKELETTGLTKYFDDIFISSDLGIKKPDGQFLSRLIEKHNLTKSECVMIGNEVLTDCGVAAACGIDVAYINSYNHKANKIEKDLKICDGISKVKLYTLDNFKLLYLIF